MKLLDRPFVFKQFADALPFGVYLLGLDKTIQYSNQAAEQITGYLGQEIVGRNCNEFLACCDPEGKSLCGTDCPVRFTFRNGAQLQNCLFVSHRDGQRIPVTVRTLSICDENGAVIAIARCFREANGCPEDLSWIEEGGSRVDPALGIYTFETTERQLRSALGMKDSRIAVFLIEIESSQELIKRHGTEMIRVAQRAVIHTLSRVLTLPHYLGRWKEDALLLLIPGCNPSYFTELQQTLTTIGSSCAVTWWGDRICLRVMVRDVLSEGGDSMENITAKLSSQKIGTIEKSEGTTKCS